MKTSKSKYVSLKKKKKKEESSNMLSIQSKALIMKTISGSIGDIQSSMFSDKPWSNDGQEYSFLLFLKNKR